LFTLRLKKAAIKQIVAGAQKALTPKRGVRAFYKQ
jgi:hypothetical protein